MTDKERKEEQWETVSEVLRITGISGSTIYRWIDKGLLEKRAARAGAAKRTLIDLNRVLELINKDNPIIL